MGLLSTQGGTPAVSWADAAKGARVEGIVIPTEDGRPYTEQQQTKSGEPDVKLTYDNGDPRMQAVVTIATPFRKWEFTSLEFQQALEPDAEDDGLRRLFIAGKNLTNATRKAIAKAKGKDVEAGAKIAVETQGKIAKGGGKTERLFTVDYDRPTPETLAVMRTHLTESAQGSLATGGDDDVDEDNPGGTSAPAGASTADDDAPPY